MTRRHFPLLAIPAVVHAQKRIDKGPPLEGALVKEFVGAAHSDLAKTRAMLEKQPALLNATWDWGGGDFETALGGASHMGQRDIALFLLEKGARLDLFAAAMLGKLDIIRASLDAFPHLVNSPGPHKIPLIVHARKGGTDAEAVVTYLEQLTKPRVA
jgi:hypothetical protein